MKKKKQFIAYAVDLVKKILEKMAYQAEHQGDVLSQLVIDRLENGWTVKPFVTLTEDEYADMVFSHIDKRDVCPIYAAYTQNPKKGLKAMRRTNIQGYTDYNLKIIALQVVGREESKIAEVLVHEALHAYHSGRLFSKDPLLSTFFHEYYSFLAQSIYKGEKITPGLLIELAKKISRDYKIPFEKIEKKRKRWLNPTLENVFPHVEREVALRYLEKRKALGPNELEDVSFTPQLEGLKPGKSMSDNPDGLNELLYKNSETVRLPSPLAK